MNQESQEKYKSEQVDPGEVTETEKGDSFPEDQSGITEPDNQLYNPSEDISEFDSDTGPGSPEDISESTDGQKLVFQTVLKHHLFKI